MSWRLLACWHLAVAAALVMVLTFEREGDTPTADHVDRELRARSRLRARGWA